MLNLWDAIHFFWSYKDGSISSLLVFCWWLWWRRNCLVLEKVDVMAEVIISKASCFLQSYEVVHGGSKIPRPQIDPKWCKPLDH